MEFVVESENKVEQKFLELMVPSMIKQLNLDRVKKTVMVLVDDHEHSGSSFDIKEEKTFLVVLKPGSYQELGLSLAHEMVHVRQMANGTLKATGEGAKVWNGKRYEKDFPYLDQPWELEAFSKQEIIFRRALVV
jgi:hypothetical protein